MSNVEFDIGFPHDQSDIDHLSGLFKNEYAKHHVQISDNTDVHKMYIYGFMIGTIFNFVSDDTELLRWFVRFYVDRVVFFVLLQNRQVSFHRNVPEIKVFLLQTN